MDKYLIDKFHPNCCKYLIVSLLLQGRTLSLCVKRSLFYDKTNGVEDSTKNGICSNFLCNVSPGDEILLTGPMGKVLLLPEKNSAADIIMIATGTGIAPFRLVVKLSLIFA